MKEILHQLRLNVVYPIIYGVFKILGEQWKNPGWLGYIGDEKLPRYNPGLFHKPL